MTRVNRKCDCGQVKSAETGMISTRVKSLCDCGEAKSADTGRISTRVERMCDCGRQTGVQDWGRGDGDECASREGSE